MNFMIPKNKSNNGDGKGCKQNMSLKEQLEVITEFESKSIEELYEEAQDIFCDSEFSKKELRLLAYFAANSGIVNSNEEASNNLGIESVELDCLLNSLRNKGIIKYVEKADGSISNVLDIEWNKMSLPWKRKNCSEISHIDILKDLFERHSKSYMDNNVSSKEYVRSIQFELREKSKDVYSRYMTLAGTLDMTAQAALLFLVGVFLQRGITPYDPINDYSEGNKDFTKGIDALIQEGLAEIVQEETGTDNKSNCKDRCRLSAKAVKKLFHGMEELVNFRSLCHQGEIVRFSDIKPMTLYFEDRTKRTIDTIRKIVDRDNFADIMARLEGKGRSCGINILMYGGPGVGKTEFARQLARENGRNLYVASASKLNGNLVGDSEKNVSELFANFRYLNAVSTNTPILLLNEADGILGKRGEETSSASRSNNVVQTIFLQEMESFCGILVATTNIESNLDPAFERRFLYKLKVSLPPAKLRADIWREHLPSLSRKTAMFLAKEYSLSGGQIENVAKKCDIEESVNNKFPDLNLIKQFCEEETVDSMAASPRSKPLKGYANY